MTGVAKNEGAGMIAITRKGRALLAKLAAATAYGEAMRKLAAMSDEQYMALYNALNEHADDPYSLFDEDSRRVVIGYIPEAAANSILTHRGLTAAHTGRGTVELRNPELFHLLTRHVHQGHMPDSERLKHTRYGVKGISDVARTLLAAADETSGYSVGTNNKPKRDRPNNTRYVFREAVMRGANADTDDGMVPVAVMRSRDDGTFYPLTMYMDTIANADGSLYHEPRGKHRRSYEPGGSENYNRLYGLTSRGIRPDDLRYYERLHKAKRKQGT